MQAEYGQYITLLKRIFYIEFTAVCSHYQLPDR